MAHKFDDGDHVYVKRTDGGKSPGTVITAAHQRCLVETSAPKESGTSRQREWYPNSQLEPR